MNSVWPPNVHPKFKSLALPLLLALSAIPQDSKSLGIMDQDFEKKWSIWVYNKKKSRNLT